MILTDTVIQRFLKAQIRGHAINMRVGDTPITMPLVVKEIFERQLDLEERIEKLEKSNVGDSN